MDTSIFLPVLTFGTMFAVIVFALVSKERTERRRKDPNAPKSTLAEDAPERASPLMAKPAQTRRDPRTAPRSSVEEREDATTDEDAGELAGHSRPAPVAACTLSPKHQRIMPRTTLGRPIRFLVW